MTLKPAKEYEVADEIRDPATETHWAAVSDAARSAVNLFRQRVKAAMEHYDLPGVPKDGAHQREDIWRAIDKAYALQGRLIAILDGFAALIYRMDG